MLGIIREGKNAIHLYHRKLSREKKELYWNLENRTTFHVDSGKLFFEKELIWMKLENDGTQPIPVAARILNGNSTVTVKRIYSFDILESWGVMHDMIDY